MGRPLTPAEEIEQLREATRLAHEVLGDLRRETRAAARLAPELVEKFNETHRAEIEQLSNHITAEQNRHAAVLNAEVATARQWMLEQIAASELQLDAAGDTVRLMFPGFRFDDHQPLPYPAHTNQENKS